MNQALRASAFALVLLAAAQSVAFAGSWSRPITVRYVMADSETRASAHQSAIDQIRMAAAAQVGTVVESVTSVDGDKFKESIQSVGVAMVRISDVTESASINAAGQVVLDVTATATVDDSELTRRAAELRADPLMRGAVDALTRQNNALRRAIDELSVQMRSGPKSGDLALALSRSAQIQASLLDNEARLDRTFAPGALSSEAQSGAATLALAKQQIDLAILDAFGRARPVASVEAVLPADAGHTAVVRLGWTPDLVQVAKVLSEYLRIEPLGERKSYLQVRNVKNTTGQRRSVLSDALFDYLADYRINLEVQIGESTFLVPALYVGTEWPIDPHCAVRLNAPTSHKEYTSLCFAALDASSSSILGLPTASASNPVRMQITRADAALASSVKLNWVVEVKGRKTQRFPA